MNGAAAFSYTIPWRRRRGPGPHRRFPRSSRRDLPPVESGIAKWFDRLTSQEVCPWNHKCSAGATESAFSPLEQLASPDARELARAFLAMTPADFATALKQTPLSRAKLSGLKRNACAVLANAGTATDVPALAAALADNEPLVRLAAVEALGRLSSADAVAAIRARLPFETDAAVLRRAESVLG